MVVVPIYNLISSTQGFPFLHILTNIYLVFFSPLAKAPTPWAPQAFCPSKFYNLFIYFWLCHTACGILVP